MTVVVNLWAGPGTGKSTNAALVFGKLKVEGVEAELVHEYYKDLVWEERHAAKLNQPYVMAKQAFHIERLIGKVEVVVTDSPLPLGLIYKGPAWTDGLGEHVLDTWGRWSNMNFFLERDNEHHPYVANGRDQDSVEDAEQLDAQIKAFLQDQDILYAAVPILPREETADQITALVKDELAALPGHLHLEKS